MALKQLIQLRGGFPWGFRLSQDHFGIRIQRVRPNSKAAIAGLLEGDVVARINQFDCRFLTLREVNYLIDQCQDILILQIVRSQDARTESKPAAVDYPRQENTGLFSSFGSYRTVHPQNWRQNSGVVVATPTAIQDQIRHPSKYVSLPRLTEFDSASPSYGNICPADNRKAYRCTIQFVHRPPGVVGESAGGSLRSVRADSVLPGDRKPYSTPISNIYSGRGYASDAESWHRSEFSFKPKGSYATAQRLFEPKKKIVTTNLYERREPAATALVRQPKFHVVRRASVEPTMMSESRRRNSATQTPVANVREKSGTAGAGTVRKVRVPSDYEGELTDDQQRDIQKLGSFLKYKSSGAYADSLFCRGPPGSYPTIEEQKRLAKRIAEILENAAPTRTRNAFEATASERLRSVWSHTRSAQTDHLITTEEEPEEDYVDTSKFSKLPKCIEDSVRQISQNELLKSVASPPQFQVLHLQDHTTHTAVPPEVCMNFARQLKYGPGKGAELFQKRKARSEKWVVDSSRIAKMAPRVAFSDTEVRSSTLPSHRKASIDSLSALRTNYFNTVPKGWISMASSPMQHG